LVRINLLPQEFRERARINWKRLLNTALIFVLAASPAAYYVYSLSRVNTYRTKIATFKIEYRKLQPVLDKRQRLTERAKFLAERKSTISGMADGIRFGVWMADLIGLVPTNVILTEMIVTQSPVAAPAATPAAPATAPASGQTTKPPATTAPPATSSSGVTSARTLLVTLKGDSASFEGVSQFLVAIDRSRYLEHSELKSSELGPQGRLSFEIVCYVKSEVPR
jgi:hypothetical protein